MTNKINTERTVQDDVVMVKNAPKKIQHPLYPPLSPATATCILPSGI